MKITKSILKQIIKEEITNETKGPAWRGSGEEFIGPWAPPRSGHTREVIPGGMDPPSPSISLDALWRDLNVLLENWTDHKHPYYKDLYNLMEDYSTSPESQMSLEET